MEVIFDNLMPGESYVVRAMVRPEKGRFIPYSLSQVSGCGSQLIPHSLNKVDGRLGVNLYPSVLVMWVTVHPRVGSYRAVGAKWVVQAHL